MYKHDFALSDRQGLICRKTQPTNQPINQPTTQSTLVILPRIINYCFDIFGPYISILCC